MLDRRCRRSVALVVVLPALLTGPAARAQAPSGGNKAAAEALFEEGRRLLAARNYREACPKFTASQNLDPALGTMMNLADCYEKNGQTASSWAQFREAAQEARKMGDTRRERVAQQRAGALEKTLSKMTITAQKASRIEGLALTRDGTPVDRALWGFPLPVDPGDHVVDASAPGYKKWTTTVHVEGTDATVEVQIPALEKQNEAVVSTGTESRRPPLLLLATAGGVALTGIAMGTILGLKANSDWSAAQSGCTPVGCSPESVQKGQGAGRAADLATIGFGVGAAGLVAGAIIWLTSGGSSSSSTAWTVAPAVGQGSAGMVWQGKY
ncbi:MAG TPA: hypothetical protein VJT73_01910 [Polyangiaceae bacterium]|nr:hypothetical protein [Polyangiaceae bacterium]